MPHLYHIVAPWMSQLHKQVLWMQYIQSGESVWNHLFLQMYESVSLESVQILDKQSIAILLKDSFFFLVNTILRGTSAITIPASSIPIGPIILFIISMTSCTPEGIWILQTNNITPTMIEIIFTFRNTFFHSNLSSSQSIFFAVCPDQNQLYRNISTGINNVLLSKQILYQRNYQYPGI